MKKLTKILILVLSVALLAGVFMLASSAATTAPEATTHVAFKIYDKTGTEITTNAKTVDGVTGYVTLKDAFDNATDGSTIKMVADFEMGAAVTPVYTNSRDLTIDFNGHTLAISYNKKDGAVLSYQVVTANSGKTLTLTGNGTLKTSIAWMASAGTILVDPGKDKTLNFVPMGGYEYKTGGTVAASSFQGNPFLKIGGNTTNNNSASKLIVRGNVNYDSSKEALGTSSMAFMGAYAGATIEIENAKINAIAGNAAHTLILHNNLQKAETVNKDWTGAKFSITNSDIYCPYGNFMDLTNAKECLQEGDTYTEPKSTSRAVRVTIDNCNLDLNGNGTKVGSVIKLSHNFPAYINVSDTSIVADESIIQGPANVVPAAVAKFTNCDVDLATNSAIQYFINNGGTVVLDNTFVKAGSNDTVFNNGYAFTTPQQAAEGTALPRYADPAYAAEEWYVGGFGNLMKNGSAVTVAMTPGAPGTWVSGSKAFALENGSFLEARMFVRNGSVCSAFVATNTRSDYIIGGKTGQFVHTFEDFDMGGESVVSYVDQSGHITPGGLSLIIGGKRTGKYSIVQTLGGTNKYFTQEHYYSASSGANGPYISLQNVPYPTIDETTGTVTPSTTNNIEDFRYYVLDFDTMSPTGNFTDTGIIFYYTSWHSKWNEAKSKYESDHVIFNNASMTLGSTGGVASMNNKEFAAEKGVWNHFTIILEIPLDEEGKPDPTKMNQADFYVYLNGNEFSKKENVYDSKNNYDPAKTNLFYEGKLDNVHMDEIRFNFPKSNATSDTTESIAFDNITLKQYYYDTTLTKESIANEYKTLPAPEALPVAKVGTDYYTDMESALEDALWLAEEEDVTIELFNDYEGLFNPDDYDFYFGDYDFNVVTNGNKFAVDGLSGYAMDDLGNGVYNVRIAKEDEIGTLSWYDSDGNLLKSVTAVKGATVEHLATIENPKKVTKTYYKAVYDAWGLDLGDGKLELAPETITVTGDMTFRPVAGTVTPIMNDVKFSVGLNDNMRVFFYIPKDFAEDKVEGIDFTAIDVSSSKNRPVKFSQMIGGVMYNAYDSYPSWTTFADKVPVTITYNAIIDGISYPLTVSYSISGLEYCDYILGKGAANYTDLEKSHVANLLRYVNEFCRAYNKGTYNANINALYQTYKSFCTEYEEETLAYHDLSLGELDKYLKSIGLSVTAGRVQYILDFKAGSKVSKVEIFKTGTDYTMTNTTIQLSTGSDRNYYYVNSADDLTANGALDAAIVKGDKKVDGKTPYQQSKFYYAVYNTESVAPMNFCGIIDITLTIDGEEGPYTVTGQYDIGQWYKNSITTAEQAYWGDFFMALKELGDTHFAYRIEVEE